MSLNNPPNEPSQQWEDRSSAGSPIQANLGEYFWTFAAVEERLVEAMRLWWRSPGEGRWPFASDAPWHLMTRRTRIEAGDYRGRELQLRMQAEDAERAKAMDGRSGSGPLTRDDVARRDAASALMAAVPERDRKLVSLVLAQLASGREQIDWSRVKAKLGCDPVAGISNKGVYRRYHRAVARVTRRLNEGSLKLAA